MKKQTKNYTEIKAIGFIILMLFLASLLTSCSKEPYGYDNLYIKFEGENPEKLMVTNNVNNGWEEYENCVDYCISFETWTDNAGIERFRFEYHGSYEFTTFYLTAFNNLRITKNGEVVEDGSMEIEPLDQTPNSLIIEAKLLPADDYVLSLSYPKNW